MQFVSLSLEPMEDKQQLHKLSMPCQVQGHPVIWRCFWFNAWEIDKRLSSEGGGPLHIPPFWKHCRNPSKDDGERSGAHQGGCGGTRLAVLGLSVLPWGKGAHLRLCEGARRRTGSLAACRLPCQPCTCSFQAPCVFHQDMQFHHLLIQACGCHVTYLLARLFGFLKCACPAPLASNMLLPALYTLQIWVPPWKASTSPAIFGTEASIVLCCSLLGSAHSSPGPLSPSSLSLPMA